MIQARRVGNPKELSVRQYRRLLLAKVRRPAPRSVLLTRESARPA